MDNKDVTYSVDIDFPIKIKIRVYNCDFAQKFAHSQGDPAFLINPPEGVQKLTVIIIEYNGKYDTLHYYNDAIDLEKMDNVSSKLLSRWFKKLVIKHLEVEQ